MNLSSNKYIQASIALANLIGAQKLPVESRQQYHADFDSVSAKLSENVMITNTNDLMIDVAYMFKQQSVMFGDEIELEILLTNNGPSNVTISAISGILIIFYLL